MKHTHAPAPSGWRRILPHPVLTLQLALTWLVLAHSLEPVHMLTALALGVLMPLGLQPLLADASRLEWRATLRLLGVVLWDIVVSNLVVARITLGSMQRPQPVWVAVPLASDHPRVNAMLASIITMTPGTVSAVIDEGHRVIWVHALNEQNPEALVHDIQQRYEKALMQVFRAEAREAGPQGVVAS